MMRQISNRRNKNKNKIKYHIPHWILKCQGTRDKPFIFFGLVRMCIKMIWPTQKADAIKLTDILTDWHTHIFYPCTYVHFWSRGFGECNCRLINAQVLLQEKWIKSSAHTSALDLNHFLSNKFRIDTIHTQQEKQNHLLMFMKYINGFEIPLL